jgi:chromosome segregation ATPase
MSVNTVDANVMIQQMATYEQRIRDLQSSRDRTNEEANRARQELDALKARHTEILSGAADAARQALEKANQLEQQLQQERARSLKAEALAAHPELTPYAELIPATTNQEELNQRIAALAAAREKDLQQQTPNIPPSNNARTVIPPANPARPNPTGQTGPSTQQMETDLRTAMEQALANHDYAAFERAVQAQVNASGLNNRG